MTNISIPSNLGGKGGPDSEDRRGLVLLKKPDRKSGKNSTAKAKEHGRRILPGNLDVLITA